MTEQATPFEALLRDCIEHYCTTDSNQVGLPLQGAGAARQVIGDRFFDEGDAATLMLGALQFFAEHSGAGLFGWSEYVSKFLSPFIEECMKLEMGSEYFHVLESKTERAMEGRPMWAE